MILDLVTKTRTYRRFDENKSISSKTIHDLLELARLSGSARNLQPLKYLISNTKERNELIFPCLGWAGYLPEWQGPIPGERPSAYILCLVDTDVNPDADCDLGIATQNILLGATEKGLGGCRIASISNKLSGLLDIPQNLKLQLVIALGKPIEKVKLISVSPDESIRYYRDANQAHFVPKRCLSDILLEPI